MQVYLNDQTKELTQPYYLQAALDLWQSATNNNHYAIAINNVFIPRSQYSSTLLQPNDRITMITPMVGG